MDEENLTEEIKLIILELLMVLHNHGITEVNVGGLMRVIGVSNEHAQESDDELMIITEKFTKYMKAAVDLSEAEPTNKTLH